MSDDCYRRSAADHGRIVIRQELPQSRPPGMACEWPRRWSGDLHSGAAPRLRSVSPMRSGSNPASGARTSWRNSTPLCQEAAFACCLLSSHPATRRSFPCCRSKCRLRAPITLHIHEDHRRAAPVREVAAFIAAEVERNHSLFHEPTARPVASPENMYQNQRL